MNNGDQDRRDEEETDDQEQKMTPRQRAAERAAKQFQGPHTEKRGM